MSSPSLPTGNCTYSNANISNNSPFFQFEKDEFVYSSYGTTGAGELTQCADAEKRMQESQGHLSRSNHSIATSYLLPRIDTSWRHRWTERGIVISRPLSRHRDKQLLGASTHEGHNPGAFWPEENVEAKTLAQKILRTARDELKAELKSHIGCVGSGKEGSENEWRLYSIEESRRVMDTETFSEESGEGQSDKLTVQKEHEDHEHPAEQTARLERSLQYLDEKETDADQNEHIYKPKLQSVRHDSLVEEKGTHTEQVVQHLEEGEIDVRAVGRRQPLSVCKGAMEQLKRNGTNSGDVLSHATPKGEEDSQEGVVNADKKRGEAQAGLEAEKHVGRSRDRSSMTMENKTQDECKVGKDRSVGKRPVEAKRKDKLAEDAEAITRHNSASDLNGFTKSPKTGYLVFGPW